MASPDTAEWLAAECYELDQLARFDTYQLTHLPCNQSCTGCCWVYKIKCDVDGNIILYHARLIAQAQWKVDRVGMRPNEAERSEANPSRVVV